MKTRFKAIVAGALPAVLIGADAPAIAPALAPASRPATQAVAPSTQLSLAAKTHPAISPGEGEDGGLLREVLVAGMRR
jgi:hypothetical protein